MEQSCRLTVHCKPNAKQNRIALASAGGLSCAIAAAPSDGKANKALVGFLAETLHIAKSRISIVKGHASKIKTVLISGLDKNNVLAKCGLLPPQ
ncbi:MAG: DUF167 domain-containing protein [Chitinivibrionales bacterium]|nr:DUF167 domain-containing protein [Chitinivibrionales bacterium]